MICKQIIKLYLNSDTPKNTILCNVIKIWHKSYERLNTLKLTALELCSWVDASWKLNLFLTCSFLFVPPGTSTDVSRYAGQYEHVFEASTAGVTLQAPQLDINTVAAGGGSRLFFRSVGYICVYMTVELFPYFIELSSVYSAQVAA